MTAGSRLSIWFFVGILLAFYGLIITGAGLYGLYSPPPVKLAHFHADLWWGLLLLALGVFYSYHFGPPKAGAR
jgi:hypothetical protein